MWFATCFLAVPAGLSAVWIRAPYELWSYVGPHHPKDHPGHYPFVSSTTFRSICDHVIDQAEGFDADVVKTGDTIYLNCWYLPWFATYIHDKIRVPYILVTCDTNTWLPLPSLKSLLHDSKCAAWFGRQMIFSGYPKVFQIPMGQDLLFFDRTTASTNVLLKAVLTKSNEKNHLLYMNFFPREKGGRNQIAKLFEHVPYCFSRNNQEIWAKINLESFYKEIASSKFVLSPWGMEFEAIRTWEAIVLGAIPIVEHSFLDPLYKDLPILLIHQWEEINEILLHKKYEELKRKPIEKAYFYYWQNLIKEVQVKVRNGTFHPEKPLFSPQDLEDLSSLIKPEHVCIYRGALTQSRPIQVANLFNTLLYTESDSKIGRCQGGALILGQAKLASKTCEGSLKMSHFRGGSLQINLKSLSMQTEPKSSGCPTPVEPIFESRAVYLYDSS
jgi:hypothetical protein